MTNEEMNAKLQEIDNKYFQKISDNWDVPQTVTFSLNELNMMRTAVTEECTRHYKTHGKYDESMRVLMRKIDKIIEDLEVQIRDGQTATASDCEEPGHTPCTSWDETSSEQEESDQPKGETFNNVQDFNDGIFDPTYINDIVDCSDLGIYPWGDS